MEPPHLVVRVVVYEDNALSLRKLHFHDKKPRGVRIATRAIVHRSLPLDVAHICFAVRCGNNENIK